MSLVRGGQEEKEGIVKNKDINGVGSDITEMENIEETKLLTL